MKTLQKLSIGFIILLIILSCFPINVYAIKIPDDPSGRNLQISSGYDISTEKYTTSTSFQDSNGDGSTADEKPELSSTAIDISTGKLVVKNLATNDDEVWTTIFAKYKTFIVGFTGVCALSCLLAFIMCFMKLGTAANNPSARSTAMTGCLVTGIGTALLGAISILFGFFFNAI